MPKPELDQMVKDAYHDPEILEYLYRNFMYHHDRVIKKIKDEHFKRLRDKK
jgi:hypothetical protein